MEKPRDEMPVIMKLKPRRRNQLQRDGRSLKNHAEQNSSLVKLRETNNPSGKCGLKTEVFTGRSDPIRGKYRTKHTLMEGIKMAVFDDTRV